MIREMIGAKTMSSMLFGNNKRKRRSMTGAMGTMVGMGVAYMVYRSMRNKDDEE